MAFRLELEDVIPTVDEQGLDNLFNEIYDHESYTSDELNVFDGLNDVDGKKLPKEIEDELNELERRETSASSLKQSDVYAKKFKEFLEANGFDGKFEELRDEELASHLRHFYSKLKSKTGQYYSPATLACIRAGIHRYLTSSPLNKNVDIIGGKAFYAANRMLKVIGSMFAKSGGMATRYEMVQKGDMDKLAVYFDRRDPQKLQQEAFFAASLSLQRIKLNQTST
jgi:hypothetical protein